MLRAVLRTSLIALVGVVGSVVLGCGDREDNEARLLLDRAARVHIDAPTEERRRHLEALEAVALSTEALDALRDTCVEGHSALIEAEEAQAGARRQLDELAGDDPDAQLPPEQAREIAQAIERSGAAIERARDKLSECRDGIADLEREHGS